MKKMCKIKVNLRVHKICLEVKRVEETGSDLTEEVQMPPGGDLDLEPLLAAFWSGWFRLHILPMWNTPVTWQMSASF